MNRTQTVHIAGGGVAGLALGLALRRRDVPATVSEAGSYPRHRVCGEFMAGLDQATISMLGLGRILQPSGRAQRVAWFSGGRAFWRTTLPEPVRVLSRFHLDASLAQAFTEAQGSLRCGERIAPSGLPGEVLCTGRQRGKTQWLGLKCHVRGLPLSADLEMHLGRRAYVGLCTLPDGAVNICGLFRQEHPLPASKKDVLPQHLERAGLGVLADALRHAEVLPESFSAVAGLKLTSSPERTGCIRLGDTFGMIAPFTGDGMSLAFQSAATAAPHLDSWAHGEVPWSETVRRVNEALSQRFARRLRAAAWLNAVLCAEIGQQVLKLAARTGMLRLRPWYGLLH